MIKDYFVIAIRGITHRKLRSWLTILGIFIGITAVVALISISEGMRNAISSQFELMGTNKIIIMPGKFGQGPMTGTTTMTESDVKVVERVRGTDMVSPFLMKMSKVEFGKEEKYTYIMGLPGDEIRQILFEVQAFRIEFGRELKEGDKYKVVIGHSVAKTLFDKEVNLGNRIKISNNDFEVIGILAEIGNREDDNSMFILMDTARDIFNMKDEISMIFLKVRSGFDVEETAENVKDALKKHRGEEDFTVLTSKQLMSQVGTILGIIQLILVGIAGISLLVGGVGIMNSMYTSVRERTKEIGIMKAVGARNIDVLSIFLIESGILGAVGGVIGCVLGFILAKGIEMYAAELGFAMLKVSITFELIALCLAFSFGLGCIAGSLPARQAAKLKPVEALRYE